MPIIHGKSLSKVEYLRRVGDAGQCFGTRGVEMTDGKARFVSAIEVDPASGLRFTLAQSKGLDILDLSYKGVQFGFETKASISSPWISDEQGMAYRGCLGAGFMYTAGPANVGGACEEYGFYHYAHGALKNTPAQNLYRLCDWQGDECTLRVGGDIRDAQFFGRNLLLKREIRVKVGERRLFLEDVLENQGFASEQYMLLYHMNLGFPLLDAGTRLYAPIKSDEPLTEHTLKNDPETTRMTEPIDGNEEYLHALKLRSDENGRTLCAVFNEALGMGLYLRYNVDVLRYLIIWKCMASGDYALGVLPSSCKPIGRAAAREAGDALYLKPFETRHSLIELGAIDGKEELASIRRVIDLL